MENHSKTKIAELLDEIAELRRLRVRDADEVRRLQWQLRAATDSVRAYKGWVCRLGGRRHSRQPRAPQSPSVALQERLPGL